MIVKSCHLKALDHTEKLTQKEFGWMSQPEHDCFDKLAVGRSEVSEEVETSEDLNSFVEGPLETSEVGILLQSYFNSNIPIY